MENALTEIASYLLGQSWQIAAVFVVVAGACWALGKSNAHWRYLLWLIVLAKCLVPPLLSVPVAVLPGSATAAQKSLTAAEVLPLAVTATEASVAEPVEIPSGRTFEPIREPLALATEPVQSAIRPSLTMGQWLAVAWMAGVGAGLLFCIFKAWRTQGRLRQTRRAANTELQVEAAELAARLGLGMVPKIWLVDGISQPFVWGLLRGGIYLPGNFEGICKAEDRRGILMHELAHVSRWDAAVNCLQVLTQAAFFFHPLVWWANRKIRQEREKCCDEVAIASLAAKPKQYGSAIVDILVNEYESSKPVPSLAVAGPVKNIEERIKTMMRPNKKFYKRPTLLAVLSVLILAALAIPTTLTLTARAEAEPEPAASLARQRYFVVLVVGKERMTFQGQETTWEELPSLLEKVLSRNHTVLELAMATEEMTLREKREFLDRARALSEHHAFEYLSDTGIKPLGSKAGPSEALYQAKFEFDKQIPVRLEVGRLKWPGPPIKCQWIRFEKRQDRLKATLRVLLTTSQTAKWRVNIILLDRKGNHVGHTTQIVETFMIVRRRPDSREKELEFEMGEWADLLASVKFEVNIQQIIDKRETTTVPATTERPKEAKPPVSPIQLSYVDDTAEGKRSIAASGHAVLFERPDDSPFVEAVYIFASRYGYPQAPKEDFHLYLMNGKFQVLADIPYPYGMIKRTGNLRWYTLRTPSIEVPKRFYVALAFNPHRTKGIYLGFDESVKRSHSLRGLPDSGYRRVQQSYDWMLRVDMAKEPSGVQGTRKLADWKPPRRMDKFKGSIEIKYDTGTSEGMQSYGGSGPAMKFRMSELLEPAALETDLQIIGFRIYAGRYGSGYDPQRTFVKAAIVGPEDKILWAGQFPYSLFSYKAKWVDLALPEPVKLGALAGANGLLTIALDPAATQYKGIYFHYNKNPKISHSLAGRVEDGFRELPDREWMIRVYFTVKEAKPAKR